MRPVLVCLVLIFTTLTLLAAGWGYTVLYCSYAPPEPVDVNLRPGSSLNVIAADLERAHVIRKALGLKLLARLNRRSHQIQAGRYHFSQPATPSEILSRLIRGDVEKASLTIPEGFTLQQIITRISDRGYGRKERLTALAADRNFVASLGVEADNLEGYLFPETYLFAPGISEEEVLGMMVRQFHQHVTSELKQSAARLQLNPHQLVTLASIIEKETAIVAEMPLISSVFHNRLQRGIPLQTDPTVIYGIENFDGNITRTHLKTPTPYNTYQIRGLPPGPIASPGLAAITAAAHPAATKYLYFVARGDGSHQFSKTLREHNNAVRKYQLRRKPAP